jgi:hypothetical protein
MICITIYLCLFQATLSDAALEQGFVKTMNEFEGLYLKALTISPPPSGWLGEYRHHAYRVSPDSADAANDHALRVLRQVELSAPGLVREESFSKLYLPAPFQRTSRRLLLGETSGEIWQLIWEENGPLLTMDLWNKEQGYYLVARRNEDSEALYLSKLPTGSQTYQGYAGYFPFEIENIFSFLTWGLEQKGVTFGAVRGVAGEPNRAYFSWQFGMEDGIPRIPVPFPLEPLSLAGGSLDVVIDVGETADMVIRFRDMTGVLLSETVVIGIGGLVPYISSTRRRYLPGQLGQTISESIYSFERCRLPLADPLSFGKAEFIGVTLHDERFSQNTFEYLYSLEIPKSRREAAARSGKE